MTRVIDFFPAAEGRGHGFKVAKPVPAYVLSIPGERDPLPWKVFHLVGLSGSGHKGPAPTDNVEGAGLGAVIQAGLQAEAVGRRVAVFWAAKGWCG
jgi:hypothetical protein